MICSNISLDAVLDAVQNSAYYNEPASIDALFTDIRPTPVDFVNAFERSRRHSLRRRNLGSFSQRSLGSPRRLSFRRDSVEDDVIIPTSNEDESYAPIFDALPQSETVGRATMASIKKLFVERVNWDEGAGNPETVAEQLIQKVKYLIPDDFGEAGATFIGFVVAMRAALNVSSLAYNVSDIELSHLKESNNLEPLQLKPIAAEQERITAEQQAEQERIAAEQRAEKERIAEEQKVQEQKVEEQRLAAEQKRAEQERLAAEHKVQEQRLTAEHKRAEQEQHTAEHKRAEQERIAAEQKEQERLTAEQEQERHTAEQERIAEEQKVEEQRLTAKQKSRNELRMQPSKKSRNNLQQLSKLQSKRIKRYKGQMSKLVLYQ